MARKWIRLMGFVMGAVAAAAAGEPTLTVGAAFVSDGAPLVLSTIDQNAPGVSLGLPEAVAQLDRPPGGVAITLLPDNQVRLYLRFQTCTMDEYGRDQYCTRPADYLFEGLLQEVGTISEGDHYRTLYDIVIPPGRLQTRLLITDLGDYFLILPLTETKPRQYRRVKLFVSAGPQ